MLHAEGTHGPSPSSPAPKPTIQPVPIRRVLVVSDLEGEAEAQLSATVQRFLSVIEGATWGTLGPQDYDGVSSLLEGIRHFGPDLIITYRHLKEREQDLPHSLGTLVDTITQKTQAPVLLLPPIGRSRTAAVLHNTDRVLVVTDHIIRDGRLITWGLSVAEKRGILKLAHVEDDATFQRYADVMGRLTPHLTASQIRPALERGLLEEPRQYMDSAEKQIHSLFPALEIRKLVKLGHAVREYKALVEGTGYDLLVFNAKDGDQVAMHGVAYSLSVELIDRPQLLV